MWLIKNTHHRRRGLRTALVGMSPLEFWGGDTVKKQVHHQATGSTLEKKKRSLDFRGEERWIGI
jgi:hypothetical protein